MDDCAPEAHDIAQIDELAGKTNRKLFSLSPNDVLVQISLPLVLILAIATRLMMIAQSMATVNQGPVILDLWKQQLILRIDHTLTDWERSAGLDLFSDISRIQWKGDLPDDAEFSALCRQTRQLADIDSLAHTLYRRALSYRPAGTEGAPAYLQDIYDPLEGPPPPDADRLPAELRMTPERRAYALNYIKERCLKWQARTEKLQWGVIDRTASRLPLNDRLNADSPAKLMHNIAAELERRGYPLLPAVTAEYDRTDNNEKQ